MARKWLGSRKATKKASAKGPAPNTAAMTTSRMKPVRRETRVSPPTVAMRLIMLRSFKSLAMRGRSLTSATDAFLWAKAAMPGAFGVRRCQVAG